MRIPLLLLASVLVLPFGMPTGTATAQTSNRAVAQQSLDSGDVVFGQITTSHPYLEEGGSRIHYETYTYDAEQNERISFTARSLDFVPGVVVLDGPGLDPERPNLEVASDGGEVAMDFYAPQQGTYLFGVVAVGPERPSGPWTFQAGIEAQPPMNYSLAYPGGGDPGERYALLVGVNDYPAIDSDLSGTVNDVMKLQRVLVDRYGFRPENVLVLTDADATREHVIEAFRRHLGQAGPSGSAVFYYSGHGTQIPDGYAGYAASDEADKADEALVLWGTGGQFSFLIDEELGGLADNLSAGHRLVILDNCHSGTGTRAPGEQLYTIRFLNMEDDEIAEHAQLPTARIAEADEAGPAGHVLLAAARSDQYSLEAGGMSENGESGGVFTYYLVNALETADPSESLASIMDRVRVDVMRTTEALKLDEQPEGQEPQAEGTRISDSIGDFLGR